MPYRIAMVVLLLLLAQGVAAEPLERQAKLYSPLRDAPPINGNPAYPAESGFGASLSVSGATAAIMEREPFGHTFLRIYERDAQGHWSARHEILPPDDLNASMKHGFGGSHALDGNRLAVAVEGYPDEPLIIVFEKIDGTWQETDRILAQPYIQSNGSFGQGGVALSGDTLAVGSPGAVADALGVVHVFVRQAGGWTLQQVIDETDPYPAAGFGSSFVLQNDRLVINRPGRRFQEHASSGVYVFDRNAGVWSQQAKITAPPGGSQFAGYFGTVMALDGDRLAIPDQEMVDVGGAGYPLDVVRIHERDGDGQWPLASSLDTGAIHQGNPAPVLSIALRDDRVVVGQVYLQNDLYAGTAPKVHLFEHDDSGWSSVQSRSPYDWEAGWVDGADVQLRYGAGFGDRLNRTGGIAFDDNGAVLVAAPLDGIVMPLQVNSNPPGAVYVLSDGTGLFCDGFEDADPALCESRRRQ